MPFYLGKKTRVGPDRARTSIRSFVADRLDTLRYLFELDEVTVLDWQFREDLFQTTGKIVRGRGQQRLRGFGSGRTLDRGPCARKGDRETREKHTRAVPLY